MLKTFKKTLLCFFTVAAFIFFLYNCGKVSPEVYINKSLGKPVRIQVEVMRTPEQRSLGLMYRKSLPKNRGMLFVFDNDKIQTFTMKNTFIPLDMIFADRTKRIVGLLENTEPLSKGPFKVDSVSRYVLEVNAFYCRKNGIKAGDILNFKNFPE